MTTKPAEYTAFLPNTLLTVVNSKAFIPFILASPDSDGVSLAALAATQHQRHAELLTLPSSTPLADVLAFFRRYDITAVPIVSDGAKSKKRFAPSDVIGMFTMQDLIRPLICHPIFKQAPASLVPHLTSAPSSPTSIPPAAAPLSEDDFKSQLSTLDVWQSPVTRYMSCTSSNRSSWLLVASQTVRDAAIALSSGLRHVLVTEGDDINSATPATIHMLSAGDLGRFIYTSLPQDTSEHSSLPAPLSHLLSSPVSAYVLHKSIVTFREDELTINAFRRLAGPTTSPLGAVPIVNAHAMVVDNLSATDLRLLTPATFHHIVDPLSTFLHTLRSTPSSHSSSQSLRPSFAATVSMDLTMQMMLEKTVNLGISRVWVVDQEAKAVGVMALSDLFRLIVGLKLSHEH